MPEIRISAEPRTEFGKGAARRTRRANRVPAVVYGHGTAPLHVSLPEHELMVSDISGAHLEAAAARLRAEPGPTNRFHEGHLRARKAEVSSGNTAPSVSR